ncbi:MAG: TrkH family potassium uptake protein [Spirochaetota bacterium]
MNRMRAVILAAFVLSIVALFVEQSGVETLAGLALLNLLDVGLVVLIILEIVWNIKAAPYARLYLKRNVVSLLFVAVFVVFFVYNKVLLFWPVEAARTTGSTAIILGRNTLPLFKMYGRMRRVSGFLAGMTTHPAQTIVLSFVVVILVGTLLLMLGFTSAGEEGLPFIDSLFTSTSAVCVTGLIVVDTPTTFSLWGHLTLMALMQVGGLGIMILSFISVYIFRRSMTLEDRYLIAYAANEEDMSSLSKSVRRIIGITFGIEAAGAIVLYFGFRGEGPRAAFLALFHAVSAFCNAGFSLFTDSLEGYSDSPVVSLSVAVLIVLGGASFVVLGEAGTRLLQGIRRLGTKGPRVHRSPLTVNTQIVLIGTGLLILLGTIGVYALEHGNVLRGRTLGEQYLSALFQSVTLRTAGFNTLPIGAMTTATSVLMIAFMFVGGASGSTAGGIKINSAAVIGAAIAAGRDKSGGIVLAGRSIPVEALIRSLMVFFLGVAAVGLGTLILSVTEKAPLVDIMFESTSAFGTVGLSRGLTGNLTEFGKLVVIALMFLGRVGPLTILAATTARRTKGLRVTYPEAEILIG